MSIGPVDGSCTSCTPTLYQAKLAKGELNQEAKVTNTLIESTEQSAPKAPPPGVGAAVNVKA